MPRSWGYFAFFRPQAEARPDVVSAASLTVGASNITATSVDINYSRDKYDYGTRTLCYDPAPKTPVSNCTTKNALGNQGSFTVTGLKSGTAYNYSIKAVDTKGGEKPYTSTGSFTTLGSTGIAQPLAGARERAAIPVSASMPPVGSWEWNMPPKRSGPTGSGIEGTGTLRGIDLTPGTPCD